MEIDGRKTSLRTFKKLPGTNVCSSLIFVYKQRFSHLQLKPFNRQHALFRGSEDTSQTQSDQTNMIECVSCSRCVLFVPFFKGGHIDLSKQLRHLEGILAPSPLSMSVRGANEASSGDSLLALPPPSAPLHHPPCCRALSEPRCANKSSTQPFILYTVYE